MLLRNFTITGALLFLLTGCAEDIKGYVVVTNIDSTPGNNIERIYITDYCSDGWGAADASGLSIAENQSSALFVVEEEIHDFPLPVPGEYLYEIRFSVRACFTSGTCGEAKGLHVEEDETKIVYIKDEGDSEVPTYCI